LSKPIRASIRPSTAGFTLVETLVALALLATVTAAIGGLTALTSRTGRYTERHFAEVETARGIVAQLSSRSDLVTGTLSGETAGDQWRVDTQWDLDDLVSSNTQVLWAPLRIAIQIRDPGGKILRFDTIRLSKRPRQ
jgi:general secretion pathway protein I